MKQLAESKMIFG